MFFNSSPPLSLKLLQMRFFLSPWPPSFLFLYVFVFLLDTISVSLCDDDERYSNCSRTYDCGPIKGISYPFHGNHRPDYCGLPEFKLECQDDSTVIEIMSERYHVLGINQTYRNLTIAGSDLWSNRCPRYLVNPNFDHTLFSFTSNNENHTLVYDCTSKINSIFNFSCEINSTRRDYFFATERAAGDYSIQDYRTKCRSSVVVPILRTAPRLATLEEVLMKGFELEYGLPYNDACVECVRSCGKCGFNSTWRGHTCFCRDGAYPVICPTPGEKINLKRKLIIGFSAAGVGILLTCLGFFIYHRYKRQQSASPALLSQDNSSSPSSKIKTDLEKGSTHFGVHIFTYEELEEATDNFHPSKELGDGGFGTVYHGKLQDGREVAVKRLYEHNFKRVEQFMNEVEILNHLRHTNLVTLYGCTSRHSRELLLVYEFIPNGTVADHLHGDRAQPGALKWPIRMNIAVQTASALAYLHASDVVHRDVKTNNILLDNNFHVKVADFGLSRLFPTDVTHISTAPQGTPGYLDPEYHQCYQLTEKSDVYSFGVVLVELISSKPAVDITRHRQEINLANMAINKIQNCVLHEFVDPYLGFESDEIIRNKIKLVAELAFRCLQHEKELRPPMCEVFEILMTIEFQDGKAEKVDSPKDDIGSLKNIPQMLSPDSVTDKWVSRSTTPNGSS